LIIYLKLNTHKIYMSFKQFGGIKKYSNANEISTNKIISDSAYSETSIINKYLTLNGPLQLDSKPTNEFTQLPTTKGGILSFDSTTDELMLWDGNHWKVVGEDICFNKLSYWELNPIDHSIEYNLGSVVVGSNSDTYGLITKQQCDIVNKSGFYNPAYFNTHTHDVNIKKILSNNTTTNELLIGGHYDHGSDSTSYIQTRDTTYDVGNNNPSLSYNRDLYINPLGGKVGIGKSNATCSLDVSGSMNVSNDVTIDGSIDVKGSLDVSNDVTIDGSIDVKGSLDVSNHVTVDGSIDVKGSLDVSNNVTVDGSIDVSDKIVLNSMGDKYGSSFLFVDSNNISNYVNNRGGGGHLFQTNNGSVMNNSFFIKNNGNVGIGTTTPMQKLDVQGSIRSRGAVEFLNPQQTEIWGRISASSGSFFIEGGAPGAFSNSVNISAWESPNPLFKVDTKTNENTVYFDLTRDSIDNNTYKVKFQLNDASGVGSNLYIDKPNGSGMTVLTNDSGGGLGLHAETDSYLPTTPHLFIRSNGNIGIGTIDPDATLTINGEMHTETNEENHFLNTTTNKYLYFQSSDNGKLRIGGWGQSGAEQILLNDVGGNVSIGTDISNAKLNVGYNPTNYSINLQGGDKKGILFASNDNENGSNISHSSGWSMDYKAGPGDNEDDGSGTHNFYTSVDGSYKKIVRIDDVSLELGDTTSGIIRLTTEDGRSYIETIKDSDGGPGELIISGNGGAHESVKITYNTTDSTHAPSVTTFSGFIESRGLSIGAINNVSPQWDGDGEIRFSAHSGGVDYSRLFCPGNDQLTLIGSGGNYSYLTNPASFNVHTINASQKNFKIPHPILEDTDLYHSSVESSTISNMYTGSALFDNSNIVELNMDIENNMTEGTWIKLNRKPKIFIQNNSSFNRCKAKMNGNLLTIECECVTNDKVDWMVVVERCDETVMNSKTTDKNGVLITEAKKIDSL
jgi:hypothetical protein